MSYTIFVSKIRRIVVGVEGETVHFLQSDGKHIAVCSNGVTIVGNNVSRKVLVKWGSGHMALTMLP